MKRLKQTVVAILASLLCAMVLPAAVAYAKTAGSLQVIPTSDGSGAVYDVRRIADETALPCNDQFNWEQLAGAELDGRPAYPAYDPSAPTAAADGRELVERVSADVLSDDAGVLAQALTAYVISDAKPTARMAAGEGPVSVEDGWYLLTAAGRRPLFAWVDGAAVELGDKSDTPVVSKQVDAGAGWTDAAIAAPGRTLKFRVDVSVPLSIEAGFRYPIAVVDEWDECLVLAEAAPRVELLVAGVVDDARDITSKAELKATASSLTLRADLCELGAKPGDVVRLSYEMRLAAEAQLDGAGVANSAYATFPSWEGGGKTPADEARVYAMHLNILKVNKDGEPLAGAVLALKNKDGWLAADGTFGSQGKRVEVTTGTDGRAVFPVALADGVYDVMELQAPKGYDQLDQAAPVELAAQVKDGSLTIKARATAPLRVGKVDASSATISLELTNELASEPVFPGGFIPQTGDSSWWLGVLVLVVSGVIALRAGLPRRRNTEV